MKYYSDFQEDAAKIIGEDLDTYKAELLSLIYNYEHIEGIELDRAAIIELRTRCQKLLQACDEILEEVDY